LAEIVTGLSRCGCLKVSEALCDFDKLRSQPFQGNVVLAKNTSRGAQQNRSQQFETVLTMLIIRTVMDEHRENCQ
jgi:hypothetical protein